MINRCWERRYRQRNYGKLFHRILLSVLITVSSIYPRCKRAAVIVLLTDLTAKHDCSTHSKGVFDTEVVVGSTVTPSLLLVEDDETDVLLFKRSLRRSGLSDAIDVATSGEEALRLIRQRRYGGGMASVVVVTDLNMPGIGGHELIEGIRADPEIARTLVFVLSSSDLDSDIRRAYENHVCGYIVKDVSTKALDGCVRMLERFRNSVSLPN